MWRADYIMILKMCTRNSLIIVSACWKLLNHWQSKLSSWRLWCPTQKHILTIKWLARAIWYQIKEGLIAVASRSERESQKFRNYTSMDRNPPPPPGMNQVSSNQSIIDIQGKNCLPNSMCNKQPCVCNNVCSHKRRVNLFAVNLLVLIRWAIG